ncbi:MAG TPA: polyphosphate kinase 1 [Rubrivivax sp.]|nr:polyphosphate kinase 1 [Rubrivivax sp.]
MADETDGTAPPDDVAPGERAPAAAAAAAPPRLLDRERAILQFSRRVLAQARRADVPLLERLRFVTIVSSNLDEFVEVRLADCLDAMRRPRSGFTEADLGGIRAAANELAAAQYALYNDEIVPALRRAGIVVLDHAGGDAAQREWTTRWFDEQVKPLLVPIGLDPSHPFPMVASKSLNFVVQLGGRDAFGRANRIAIVKVPGVLPGVVRLPRTLGGARQVFVLLTALIRAHLPALFPGRCVQAHALFRVTRNVDFEVDEDEITNLHQALRSHLGQRHFGDALRLEVAAACPQELCRFLLALFALPEAALCRVGVPLTLLQLAPLLDEAEGAALRYAPFEPAWPAALDPARPIFAQLRERDVLLHHPFESFEPVVRFLREAVRDPQVLAIKQTIYRTGSESVLMELLIEAARRGKEVLVVLELKARLDEEANINWAERLEAEGVQAVYGIVGLKTHAKLLLVTRREPGRGGSTQLRRYVHLSTGNYNSKTARLYTDIGHLSADPGLVADAEALFRQLTSQTRARSLTQMVSAPFTLHRRMLRHLLQVADAARAGHTARVVVKVNALTDPLLIAALLDAARAGARIDLVVRGACLLVPGRHGVAETVRVRSVVGRFLEHTRICYFRWGAGDADEVLYLSSADWMSRNLFARIEIAWPVRDAALRQRVIDEALVPYLHDERDAWELGADGGYRRVSASGVSAQQALLEHHCAAAPRSP